MTSHDVVAKVRRAARVKRVGHAGTLDPAAEGVLLVCVGPATGSSTGSPRRGSATGPMIELGATTTTDDATGEVLERRDASRRDARGRRGTRSEGWSAASSRCRRCTRR